MGREKLDASTFLKFISTRIITLKEKGLANNELIELWSDACQQVIMCAYRNIEIAKDICSKDKYSSSTETNPFSDVGIRPIWDEIVNRERQVNKANSIKELNEKDLLNKTYTQLFIYISIAIKNCELLPVNGKTKDQIELLKKVCQSVLHDKYYSAKPTIELLSETELFNKCQSNKSYEDYLRCYPYGEFSRKAERAKNKRERIIVTILIIVEVIIIGILFYFMFIRKDWIQSLIIIGIGAFIGLITSLKSKIFGL